MKRQTRRPSKPARQARSAPLAGPWIALAIATFAVYFPAWHGGVLWDDDAHLTPTALQSLEGLGRIWFEMGATQQYYPLTHTAFWLQHHLWGTATTGYHLVNIALHATSAWLVGLILRRLMVPGAWLAAAIFALHPVQAESVAWMTELKNTLSGVCFLAAAWHYLQFDDTRAPRSYARALVWFVAALLSKTVTATLPAGLLVVAWWKRGRLSWSGDVRPLVPFIALGLAAGLTTAWVERSIIGAAGAEYSFSLIERTLIAGRAVWFYLASLAWPMNLAFTYPRWEIDGSVLWQYGFPAAALVLAVVLWFTRHWSRAPLAAFAWFVLTLAPALGFVNVFPFRYSFVADHFQYLACISVFALAAAGASLAAARWGGRVAPARMVAAAICLPLALLTWRESQQYVSAETLFRTTLDRNPASWMAHHNLGEIAAADGRLGDAVAHLEAAVRLNPREVDSRSSLGLTYLRTGRFADAGRVLSEAARLDPDHWGAQHNLGLWAQAEGRFAQAVEYFQRALQLKPAHAETQMLLGLSWAQMGQRTEAVTALQEAIRLNPTYLDAINNLGMLYEQQGRFDLAAAQFDAALRVAPGQGLVLFNLGRVLLRQGRFAEAEGRLREAVARDPGLGADPDFVDTLNRAVAGKDIRH